MADIQVECNSCYNKTKLEYDMGFFCESCGDRIESDDILVCLLAEVSELKCRMANIIKLKT